MKKKVSVILIFTAVLITFAACSSASYTDAERFAARANVTIDRNVQDYQPGATNYSFSTIEFFFSGSARVVRADCHVRTTDEESNISFEREVFLISDSERHLLEFIAEEKIDEDVFQDRLTELWFVGLRDFEFTPVQEYFVDSIRINTLRSDFMKSQDKGILGME